MMTRQECVKRYGRIDFTARHWANQSAWMASYDVPDGWFPNWHVSGTKHVVDTIYCNKDVHAPLARALAAVRAKGLGAQLKTFGGCFNIRMVRGSNDHFSAHSYGLALDFDPETERLGETTTDFTPEFIKCFESNGFRWGGHFNGRKDPMHFSLAGF